jgi:hypothetical protein
LIPNISTQIKSSKQRASPFLGLEEKAVRKLTIKGLVKAIESKTESPSHERK